MAVRFLTLLLVLLPGTSFTDELLPLFAADKALDVTIKAPMFALARDTDEEPEYRPGVFSYVDADGAMQSFDIGIRPRGRNRRNKDTCDYPPLRLNFRGKQVKDTLFAGQDKLKLVAGCRRGKSYQQYVLQEYLIYRVYNLFTEQSFRVRLLNVTFTDSDGKGNSRKSIAFLIEDREHMAARGGFEFKTPQSIRRHELDIAAATRVGLFQYLIGNTDWSILDGPGDGRCCHNSILIAREHGSYVPVPYDFDYSGIINTPYAVPAESVSAKSVITRVYRGFCRAPVVLNRALQEFRDNKQAIYDLYANQAGLTSAKLKSTHRYLDRFYKTIEDPKRLKQSIVNRCR